MQASFIAEGDEWIAEVLGNSVGLPGPGAMDNPRRVLVFYNHFDERCRGLSIRGVDDAAKLPPEQLRGYFSRAVELPIEPSTDQG